MKFKKKQESKVDLTPFCPFLYLRFNDIAKKGKDDFDSSEKLIVHFDEMIEMFVKAQSKIIDII